MKCIRILFAIIVFVLLTGNNVIGQTDSEIAERDSLKRIYPALKTDAQKIVALQKIADYELRFGAFERTQKHFVDYYLEEFVALGTKNKINNIEAYQYWYNASILLELSKFNLAITDIKNAIAIFDKEKKRICHLISLLRQPYNALNLQPERIQFYTDKLNYYLERGQLENAASCIHGQAGYFRLNSALNIAISKYLKAADLYLSEHNFIGYSNGISVVGQAYLEWGNTDKALFYLEKALSVALPKKDSVRLATIYIGFGDYYLEQKKFDRAYGCYDSVLLMSRNISGYFLGSKLKQGLSLLGLGKSDEAFAKIKMVDKLKDSLRFSIVNSQGNIEVDYAYYEYYKYKGDDIKAKMYILKALDEATVAKSNLLRLKYLPILIDFLQKKGYDKEALRYSDTLLTLNNEMDKVQKPFKIAYYESEQRERDQYDSLNTLKQEKLVQAAVLRKSNLFLWLSLIGLLFITVAMFYVYRQFQINKKTLATLRATQNQLVQAEKMASLGELTAGIAHEIQNPLNFVNNFAELNQELLSEMDTAITQKDFNEAIDIAKDVTANSEKILHHGKRAESIVKGMLQHSRSSSGVKESTDINALCDEYLRLAYHGWRAKEKNFHCEYHTQFDSSLQPLKVIPQELGRVLLNLINNAFYAVDARSQNEPDFKPQVLVKTTANAKQVSITVTDNGIGIPPAVVQKIFQPFFTTKPTGEGTGLGLSMSYDIITKGHDGELSVESKEGEGTSFVISLPL